MNTALIAVVFGALLAHAGEPPKVYRDLTAAEARLMIEKKKSPVIVLDVRTAHEYSEGHIARASNIDFHAPDFRDRIAKLDRSRTYLVHCAAGGRSAKTSSLMRELGFQKVFHMPGGFREWTSRDFPVAN